MTDRKPLTAADFIGTNGRRVLVELKIHDKAPSEAGGVLVTVGGSERICVPHTSIVEILPDEIEVGDIVAHHGYALGEVRLVEDGYIAVVRALDDGNKIRAWWPASFCTLVEKAK